MTIKEIKKFTAHCDKYFHQDNCIVIHPESQVCHIDVLLYRPNEKYGFWKLVTMGASDYKMPDCNNNLGDRNEYMLVVPGDANLDNRNMALFYYRLLVKTALGPVQGKYFFSYGHSMEWGEDVKSELIEDSLGVYSQNDVSGIYATLPQCIDEDGFLKCQLGLTKKTSCLQVVLLDNKGMNMLLEKGAEALDDYLYPENKKEGRFLSNCKMR